MPTQQVLARLRIGSTLLALSSVGLLAAPLSMLRDVSDLTIRADRHTLAGALALVAVAIVECLLALIPIRRGEQWAIAAAAVPFLVVGIPVLLIDATHVASERLWTTIGPQVFGLFVGGLALTLCAVGRPETASEERSVKFPH